MWHNFTNESQCSNITRYLLSWLIVQTDPSATGSLTADSLNQAPCASAYFPRTIHSHSVHVQRDCVPRPSYLAHYPINHKHQKEGNAQTLKESGRDSTDTENTTMPWKTLKRTDQKHIRSNLGLLVIHKSSVDMHASLRRYSRE